ncbi:MAG: FMN reductase, partial [Sciscionella sp.]
VGCVAAAHGWQAAVTTLTALRQIVHALRGWPTPLGAAVNSADVIFGADGSCSDEKVARNLRTIGAQVAEFAVARGGSTAPIG